MSNYQRKIALVTGAARGIGAEAARQLAAHGFEVIVTARDVVAAEKVSATITVTATAVAPQSSTSPTPTASSGSVEYSMDNRFTSS